MEIRLPGPPGAPDRRFRLRPARLLALLVLVAALGGAAGAGGVRILWRQDQDALGAQLAELRGRVDQLTAAITESQRRPPAAAAEVAPASPPPLEIPLPPPENGEPTVRLALLRTTQLQLRGAGLVLEHGTRDATPLNDGLDARVQQRTVHAAGVGPLKDGTRVVNRLGPIQAGERELPSEVELFADGDEVVVVGVVPLERYVAGVVGSELPASWQGETRKAQAVAARTYALMQRALSDRPWHLETTVDDQVYNGRPVAPGTSAAVAATHGEVVTADGFLASTFFHSTCGGRTEDPAAVWPDRPSRGVRAATCGYCDGAPAARWQVDLSAADLVGAARGAGGGGTELRAVRVGARTAAGRVAALVVETDAGATSIPGNELRRTLGWTRLKSTWFEVTDRAGGVHLAGRGLGHGVGLCQWGAEGMARKGEGYRAILANYYPDTKVQRLY